MSPGRHADHVPADSQTHFLPFLASLGSHFPGIRFPAGFALCWKTGEWKLVFLWAVPLAGLPLLHVAVPAWMTVPASVVPPSSGSHCRDLAAGLGQHPPHPAAACVPPVLGYLAAGNCCLIINCHPCLFLSKEETHPSRQFSALSSLEMLKVGSTFCLHSDLHIKANELLHVTDGDG